MNKLLKAFGLIAALSSAGSMSAASILYWSDYTVGTDMMAGALSDLSGTHSITTASSDGDFATQLTGGGYDLAILAIQNYGADSYSSDEALGAYVLGGGRAIFQYWVSWDSTPLVPFEASFTGGINMSSVTVTDAALSAGLSSNPLSLSNPGWGTFSTGLGGTGTSGGTFGSESAIMIGNGGRTIVNGFLTDTISDYNDGKQLYKNEIGYVLGGASTPDAGSSLLLLAIGSGAIAMMRGQRRKLA